MIIASPALYLISTDSSSFPCSQDSGEKVLIPSVFGFPLSRRWIFIFRGETRGLQRYIRCCSIYLSGLSLTGLRPKPQWCCLKEGEILLTRGQPLWKLAMKSGITLKVQGVSPPVFKLKHAKTSTWQCLPEKTTLWGWGRPVLVWRWNHPTGMRAKMAIPITSTTHSCTDLAGRGVHAQKWHCRQEAFLMPLACCRLFH